jgi:hypothetical protein
MNPYMILVSPIGGVVMKIVPNRQGWQSKMDSVPGVPHIHKHQ